jgi:hypothetical protein
MKSQLRGQARSDHSTKAEDYVRDGMAFWLVYVVALFLAAGLFLWSLAWFFAWLARPSSDPSSGIASGPPVATLDAQLIALEAQFFLAPDLALKEAVALLETRGQILTRLESPPNRSQAFREVLGALHEQASMPARMAVRPRRLHRS